MVMYEITDLQYQAVYNVLSFSPAGVMATTLDIDPIQLCCWSKNLLVLRKFPGP